MTTIRVRVAGAPEPVQSEGSGFIVRQDGFIYTNFHVVEDADSVQVKLQDGREFPGKVVGTDEKTDIAVIKVDATNLPVVQLADSDAVRVGQFAFAIGAPFKLDYTFTYGVISGKGRSKLHGDERLQHRGLFADRHFDQPRQQRRPALRHRRQSGGDEHAHQRPQSRPRFRHPEQFGERNRPAIDCRAQDHQAMARHPD